MSYGKDICDSAKRFDLMVETFETTQKTFLMVEDSEACEKGKW